VANSDTPQALVVALGRMHCASDPRNSVDVVDAVAVLVVPEMRAVVACCTTPGAVVVAAGSETKPAVMAVPVVMERNA
jgi:hypothetical protein